VIDLRDAVASVLAHGAAHVPTAIEPDLVRRLQGEIQGGPFEAAPEEVGPVRQRTDAYSMAPPFDGAVGALAEELAAALRDTGVRGLRTWVPNDAAVQRYRPGPIGITPHLDGKRFRRVIAVVTTKGRARFALHPSREAEPSKTWIAVPGDLVLLRAPGLGGRRDGRPFHSIGPPDDGVRFSIGLRMDSRAQ
jgi:hypothetical protein